MYGTTNCNYSRVHRFVARLVCLGTLLQIVTQCNATTFLRYRVAGGYQSLFVSKNGVNMVGEYGTGSGPSTGEIQIGGELEDGDILRMWLGTWQGTVVYRDDDLGAEYVHTGATSASGTRFPTATARWDTGEAAPPTTWCIAIFLSNNSGGAADFIVNYLNPTTGLLVTPFEGYLLDGQSTTFLISGLSATVHVGVGERTIGGLTYLGLGEFSDEGEPGPWSFRGLAGPTDPGWYVCSGTPDDPKEFILNMAKVGLDNKGTNLPINFQQTNVVENPSNATNMLTEKSGQIGFQSLAVLAGAANKLAAQAALDTGAKLDGIRDALRAITNGHGTASTVYAITNGTAQVLAGITNSLGGGGTNAGLLRALVHNTSNIVDHAARLREISEGGGVSNSVVSSELSSAASMAGVFNATNSLDMEITEQDGRTAVGAAQAAGFTAPDSSVFRHEWEIGPGIAPLVFDFDIMSNPIVVEAVNWIRLLIESALILGFFYMCFRRGQKYLWDLLIASNVKPISGGVITEFGNRTIGYLLVSACMAVIASVPGVVSLFLTEHGGWGSAFAAASNMTSGGSGVTSHVAQALGYANYLLPLTLIVTQFLSRIVFEIMIAKVCIAAMAILRFIKVFAFIVVVTQVSVYGVTEEKENRLAPVSGLEILILRVGTLDSLEDELLSYFECGSRDEWELVSNHSGLYVFHAAGEFTEFSVNGLVDIVAVSGFVRALVVSFGFHFIKECNLVDDRLNFGESAFCLCYHTRIGQATNVTDSRLRYRNNLVVSTLRLARWLNVQRMITQTECTLDTSNDQLRDYATGNVNRIYCQCVESGYSDYINESVYVRGELSSGVDDRKDRYGWKRVPIHHVSRTHGQTVILQAIESACLQDNIKTETGASRFSLAVVVGNGTMYV